MDPRGWTLARGFSPPPPRGARGRGSTRAAHPGSTSKQVSGLADRQSTAAVMMMMSLNRKTNWRRSTVGKRSFSTNHFAACDAARKICCRIRKQIYGTQSGNFEKKPNSSQPDSTRDPGGLRRRATVRNCLRFMLARAVRVGQVSTARPSLSQPPSPRVFRTPGRSVRMANEGVDWALSFGDGADVEDDGPDVNAQAPGPASRGGAGGANKKAPQEPKTVRPRTPPGRSRDACARFRA